MDAAERRADAAARELADRDPVIARLYAERGVPHFPIPRETPLESLVRGITFQQIAGAAATAIHGRLVAELGGTVSAAGLAALSDDAYRRAGLSAAKVRSLRDLAEHCLRGGLELEPAQLASLDDDAIIARLSAVRGIGPWSAQMFLIFQLHRLDVWPVGDLAVRKGYGIAWQVPAPTARELLPLGERFQPYRTVVAWYCWAVAGSARATGRRASAPPLGANPERQA